MSDDGWCARCGQYPAVRGTDFCRLHDGHAPRPRETTPPEQTSYCTYRPLPGEVLKTACPDCGHAAVLHVGVEHCPVCELVQHNRQMRAAMAANRIEVHVTGVDQRVLERTLEQMSLRAMARGGRYRR